MPDAERVVLGDGHAGRVDVDPAGIAPVEVIPSAMVQRVVAPPMGVGRQCQQCTDLPEPVVGAARAEEGSVAAIVLDDEGPHRQPGRGNAQRQERPPAEGEPRMHRPDQRNQRQNGGDDLPGGDARQRALKMGRDVAQPGCVRHRRRGFARSRGVSRMSHDLWGCLLRCKRAVKRTEQTGTRPLAPVLDDFTERTTCPGGWRGLLVPIA